MRQITDRFLAAVKLCVSAEPVKLRLSQAWTTHLEDIGSSELPEQLRPEFCRLREAMHTADPLPHESAAVASVRKMSARQANKQTVRILRLSQELQRITLQTETARQTDRAEEFYMQGLPSTERLN